MSPWLYVGLSCGGSGNREYFLPFINKVWQGGVGVGGPVRHTGDLPELFRILEL